MAPVSVLKALYLSVSCFLPFPSPHPFLRTLVNKLFPSKDPGQSSLITSAKTLFLFNVTYSQISRVRMWIFGGVIILFTTLTFFHWVPKIQVSRVIHLTCDLRREPSSDSDKHRSKDSHGLKLQVFSNGNAPAVTHPASKSCHISLFGHHCHFYSKSLQSCFKAGLSSLSPHPPPPLLPLGLTLITLLSSFQTTLISSTDSSLPNSIVNSYFSKLLRIIETTDYIFFFENLSFCHFWVEG